MAATLESIKPGTHIDIKVVKRPTNAAGVKTLVRVLRKDREAMREDRRLRDARERNTRHEQRGGRQWAVRVPAQRPVQAEAGETGRVLASVDVIRDLQSVEKFVEVSPAE